MAVRSWKHFFFVALAIGLLLLSAAALWSRWWRIRLPRAEQIDHVTAYLTLGKSGEILLSHAQTEEILFQGEVRLADKQVIELLELLRGCHRNTSGITAFTDIQTPPRLYVVLKGSDAREALHLQFRLINGLRVFFDGVDYDVHEKLRALLKKAYDDCPPAHRVPGGFRLP